MLNYIKSKYRDVKCGLIIGYGLNIMYLKNNFDFNIVSYHYCKRISNDKLTIIFNIDKNNCKLDSDVYLITNSSFKFII